MQLVLEKVRFVSSSVDWVSLGSVFWGASFTAVTVNLAVSVAVLKAVEPPLVVVSTLSPGCAVPERSQAR